MDTDDFDSLYRELRGSRSSGPIMDAKFAFADRDYQQAQTLLTDAYETYKESRARILRQDAEKQVEAKAPNRDQQVRRLKRKQEKATELIEKFEELLPQIGKLVDRDLARKKRAEKRDVANSEPEPKPTNEPKESPSMPVDDPATDRMQVPTEFETQFRETSGDDQLDVVSQFFGFRPVSEGDEISSGSLYLLRDGKKSILFVAEKDPLDPEQVLCIDYFSPATTVSMTPSTMAQLSEDRKLVMLLGK